ncbi:creatininase family protein [Microbacterium sp. cx-55]|uniref:creatininase family protein n=1 Tax=unclassified Microbacterium TaxID=2609290 RepID=UPI001CC17C8B|nr:MULTISPECIES: creatininase family protein [unclassified Microbacterium]MBZ4487009.1 creatininase family protein [Microbacterium sp. cx-55]MCC4907924.1 creatininase family protein [Microbacterium sp. cx-59]UGB35928.1 creatininase family protein [Microbacterium sp. cx-55]
MTAPFTPPGRRWDDLSGPSLVAATSDRSIAVVPIGAIEHHGPHLPLRTDALIAEAVASAAVERVAAQGVDAWLLPTIAYAKSDEHHWAPGTLWIEGTTLLDELIEIGRSIAMTPVRTVAFVNGHGGNVMLLGWVNRELRRRFGLRSFSMPAGVGGAGDGADGRPDELGQGIHAGFGETSIVMHLAPHLVAPEMPPRNVPERIAAMTHIGFNRKPVMFGWTSDDFGPTGVIGDATGANAAAGRDLFDRGVDFVSEALVEIDGFEFG